MNKKRRAEVKRIMEKLKDDVYSLLDKKCYGPFGRVYRLRR